MSWPKAGVRLEGTSRKLTVVGWDPENKILTCKFYGYPNDGKLVVVKPEDVKWVNVEAARQFGLHEGFTVIADGYGADQKMEAYNEAHRKT